MANKPTLSLAELSEIRTVIALSRANYNHQHGEVKLLLQLIGNEDDHIFALRTLVNSLLNELDTYKRDANEVLTELVEIAAMADARP